MATTYLSPGVYVEEVPSAIQTIAGVSTSTAAFIGVSTADPLIVPATNPRFNPTQPDTTLNTIDIRADVIKGVTLGEAVGALPIDKIIGTDDDVKALIDELKAANTTSFKVKNTTFLQQMVTLPAVGDVKLCTNFSEFKSFFGDFSTDPGQNQLAHAVYGFFGNGGSRCYVVRITGTPDLDGALAKFGAIDEIAIVAAPGLTGGDAATEGPTYRSKLQEHCAIATQDRFAIFDSPEVVGDDKVADLQLLDAGNAATVVPDNTNYAAFYFPWLQVFDPVTKLQDAKSKGLIFVPPSGHMAGIYARVDNTRGVFKAPANEVVIGAQGLKYQISKAQQDGLNPQGVNCIRRLNGAIRVWGARTVGGDANGEWRYINVRRTFLYLRESIDEGTQWAVFEPNDQNLWAKITRNVSAFLTGAWRAGALFGATPDRAFFVKCDAETNPPDLQEIGQVVTEIGVAVVRPAEFVIFRITQWRPPSAS